MEKYEGYRLLKLRELQLLQLEAMKEIHNACECNKINYYIIGGSLLGAIRHQGFIPWDDDIDIAMLRPDFEKFKSLFYSELNKEKYFLQHYDSDQDFQPAMLRVCIKGTIVDLPSEQHLRYCKNTYIDVFPLDNVPNSNSEREKHIKDLKIIDRLINIKLYKLFESNNMLQKAAKKTLSILLKVVPLKYLQNKRVITMTKFQDVHTSCVASTCSQYGYRKQIMDRTIYGHPSLYKFEDTYLYGPEKYDEYLSHLFTKKYMQVPPENKRVKPHNVYIKI